MVRKLPALLAALVAAIGAGALAVTLSAGSSHREAPLSSIDPTADDTDVYAFKAPDAPNALTIVANWIPFEDPAGGPNFYRLDDRAAYYLNVDNTGDGRYDVRYRFKFKTKVLDKNSFLYALPGVSVDPRPEAQRRSRPTRSCASRTATASETGRTVLGTDLPVAPNNVGPKTFPNYGAVAGAAVRHLNGGGRVFVGPGRRPVLRRPRHDLRRDQHPQRHRQRRRRQGRSRGLQRPLGRPAGPGDRGHARPQGAWPAPRRANAVVGVWASTNRERVAVSRRTGLRPEHERPPQGRREGPGRRRGPGQPPGQPARQRGRHPAREEGPLQRDAAVGRPEELRQVRALAAAREGHQRAVPGPQRPRDEPHRHRPGAAHRHPRPDPDPPRARRRPTR